MRSALMRRFLVPILVAGMTVLALPLDAYLAGLGPVYFSPGYGDTFAPEVVVQLPNYDSVGIEVWGPAPGIYYEPTHWPR